MPFLGAVFCLCLGIGLGVVFLSGWNVEREVRDFLGESETDEGRKMGAGRWNSRKVISPDVFFGKGQFPRGFSVGTNSTNTSPGFIQEKSSSDVNKTAPAAFAVAAIQMSFCPVFFPPT